MTTGKTIALTRWTVYNLRNGFCLFQLLWWLRGLKHLPAMQETWVGKIPWRRKWQPTPVLLPGQPHGWRSLVGYSPRGCKESDTTEQLHFHFVCLNYNFSEWQFIQARGQSPAMQAWVDVCVYFNLFRKAAGFLKGYRLRGFLLRPQEVRFTEIEQIWSNNNLEASLKSLALQSILSPC